MRTTLTAQQLSDAILSSEEVLSVFRLLARRAELDGTIAYTRDISRLCGLRSLTTHAALDWLEQNGLVERFAPSARSNTPEAYAVTRQAATVTAELRRVQAV